MFDNLVVKTPDGNFPLIQLGQVVQKSPQLLTINMASSPQVKLLINPIFLLFYFLYQIFFIISILSLIFLSSQIHSRTRVVGNSCQQIKMSFCQKQHICRVLASKCVSSGPSVLTIMFFFICLALSSVANATKLLDQKNSYVIGFVKESNKGNRKFENKAQRIRSSR